MASLVGGTCVCSFWSWVAGGEGYRGRCGWWNRLAGGVSHSVRYKRCVVLEEVLQLPCSKVFFLLFYG